MRRLDNENDFDFTIIFMPLHIGILMLMVSTVTRRPGNPCEYYVISVYKYMYMYKYTACVCVFACVCRCMYMKSYDKRVLLSITIVTLQCGLGSERTFMSGR